MQLVDGLKLAAGPAWNGKVTTQLLEHRLAHAQLGGGLCYGQVVVLQGRDQKYTR